MNKSSKLNDNRFPILWTVYHTIIAVEILALVILQSISVALQIGNVQ